MTIVLVICGLLAIYQQSLQPLLLATGALVGYLLVARRDHKGGKGGVVKVRLRLASGEPIGEVNEVLLGRGIPPEWLRCPCAVREWIEAEMLIPEEYRDEFRRAMIFALNCLLSFEPEAQILDINVSRRLLDAVLKARRKR